MNELVHLPDPAVRSLVHPLDVPEARRPFLQYWLITTLTDPSVAFCVAGLLWFATRNPAVSVLAGLAIVVGGWYAQRCVRDQAWSFIPGKRQDRERPLPLTWALGANTVFAVLFAAVVLLIALRLGRPDVPAQVRVYTFDFAAATAVLVLASAVVGLVRSRESRSRTLITLPGVVATVAAVAVSYGFLLGG
ncbi:MAG TPA: hypothetical protein VGL80_12975 [Pseudonocardiaceae bacterium]|jgi:hypothetical protein